MKKAVFSFLLVIGFIPAMLYSVELHSSAVRAIVTEKTLLLEQQVLTNKENMLEDTFWKSIRTGGASGIAEWKKHMEQLGITVTAGIAEPGGVPSYQTSGPVESLVELSPDGKAIEIKSENPFSAVIGKIHVGNSSTVFMIPVGCYHGM
ncbi:MAG: hypothetical protein J7L23_01465 [Candidatus Diapherotrites archaeon]|nr:hypothetical protein [Candidatus Diapherotrites archaeon]